MWKHGVLLGALLIGCRTPPVIIEDAGTEPPQADAGASQADAGAPLTDAGAPLTDASAPAVDAASPPDAAAPGSDAAAPQMDASTPPPDAAAPAERGKPLVTLLIDTSGSMTWRASCACESVGCLECDVDCASPARPRWHDVLAAVSGSFDGYACSLLARIEDNGASYDVGYTRPIIRLAPGVQQRADGLLDRYQDRVQFGLATFDAMLTYSGVSDLVALGDFDFARSRGPYGAHSYAGGDQNALRVRPDGTVVGKVYYPTSGEDYFVDWGVMSALAPSGALLLPRSDAYPPQVSADIKQQLRDLQPFGGTATSAALDDLYFAFGAEDASDASAPRPGKRYLLLITDGVPDEAFRQYGCGCAAEGTCPPGEDPARMSCPYPTASAAAQHLRCGFDPQSCNGPVSQVHVVSYSASTELDRSELGALAAAGGGTALFPNDPDELTRALDQVLTEILADNTR